jgi:hypothetical protein
MSGIRATLGQRRAIWRHGLLACVALFALQAAAPALAWCLHDDASAHVESALTHCDHADPQHKTLDAEPPGASATHGGGTSAPGLASVARLSLADWLADDSRSPSARPRIADTRLAAWINGRFGHSIRLLI